jgi:hypothetical protein
MYFYISVAVYTASLSALKTTNCFQAHKKLTTSKKLLNTEHNGFMKSRQLLIVLLLKK